LEKLITALLERKKAAPRLTKSSKLYKSIINAIQEKKGEKIIALDLKKIDEAVADFFILCDARSNIQVRAIAQSIEDAVEQECEERPYHVEHGDTWTLVDYVNIVVHIFQHEQRTFYNLESLWEDAARTEY
jgi:ribosome-associated protein